MTVDRKLAISSGISVERYDKEIRIHLEELRKGIDEMEEELSKAEIASSPNGDTKNWENALLDIAKIYDKIEGNFATVENGLSSKFEKKREKTVHFAQEDTTIDMNEAELLQYQDQIMSEQDTHLDHLSQVLNRHKDIGMKLADELNYQAELLEQTENAIENTRDRVRTVDRRMNTVMATDNGRFSTTNCIIILVIILIIVIILAKKL